MIKACRLLIRRKRAVGSNVHFEHVHSHSGKDDPNSQGNALADLHASADASRHAPPHLQCEETMTFWQSEHSKPCKGRPGGLHHVAGNLRSVLQRTAEDVALTRWRACTTQGWVARQTAAAAAWLTKIRKTGDGGLLLFALQMSTMQLPTPDRMLWGPARAESELTCKLCGKRCSPRHPFTCEANTKAARRLDGTVKLHLANVVKELARTGATPGEHTDICCLSTPGELTGTI